MPNELPTHGELVAAFIKDLSNVASLFAAEREKPTIPLWIYVQATSTVTWTPDVDYFVLNVICEGPVGQNLIVSIDNSTYAQNHNTGVVKKGAVLASITNNVSQIFPQRTLIAAHQRVTVNNAAASATAVLIYLEEA